MRTTKELYDLLLDVEELTPIDEMLVGDRNVWPVLRVYAATRLVRKTPDFVSRSRQPRWFGVWQEKLRQETLDKADDSFQTLRPAGFLTIDYSSHRTEKVDGKGFNPHLDPLHYFWKERRGLHLEVAFSPSRLAHSYYAPSVSLMSRLHRYRMKVGFSKRHWTPQMFQWCNKMEKLFNDSYFHSENVSLWIDMLLAAEAMFEDILDEVRPSAVFVAGFYDPILFAAVRIAKSRSIPVVDIQHEPLLEKHYGYHGWKRMNDQCYAYLPQHLWRWTAADSDNLLHSFKKESIDIHTSGNPYEDMRQSLAGNTSIEVKWNAFFESLVNAKDSDTAN